MFVVGVVGVIGCSCVDVCVGCNIIDLRLFSFLLIFDSAVENFCRRVRVFLLKFFFGEVDGDEEVFVMV